MLPFELFELFIALKLGQESERVVSGFLLLLSSVAFEFFEKEVFGLASLWTAVRWHVWMLAIIINVQ